MTNFDNLQTNGKTQKNNHFKNHPIDRIANTKHIARLYKIPSNTPSTLKAPNNSNFDYLSTLQSLTSSYFLHLIQNNGKLVSLLWSIPSNGGTLEHIFSLDTSKNPKILIPDAFLLQNINFIFSKNNNTDEKDFLWLLNTQETLTCAINEVLLHSNNRKAVAEGDSIQIGSLLFMLEVHPLENLSQANGIDNTSVISPAVSATAPASTLASADSAVTGPQVASAFELADLDHMLSDTDTDRSLGNINIEKAESEYLSIVQHDNIKKPAFPKNTEQPQSSNSSEKPAREDGLMERLHHEYLDVLQDPRLLVSQNLFSTRKQSTTEGDQSLQDLIQQASCYDSLHDLLQSNQTERVQEKEQENLDDYEILQPELKTNVMLLFAPEHLQQQSNASDLLQLDPLKALIPSGSDSLVSTHFKSLPTLNQREHHSAVVGGLMDLNPPSQKPQQD